MTKAEAMEGTGREGRCVNWSLAFEELPSAALPAICRTSEEHIGHTPHTERG